MIPDSRYRFEHLELHDGVLGDISLGQDVNGDWNASISIRSESISHRLQFKRCRAIKTDIKGGMARPDVIGKHEASVESSIFIDASKWPSPLPDGSFHYLITTNSGSRIDIVAEAFELTSGPA